MCKKQPLNKERKDKDSKKNLNLPIKKAIKKEQKPNIPLV